MFSHMMLILELILISDLQTNTSTSYEIGIRGLYVMDEYEIPIYYCCLHPIAHTNSFIIFFDARSLDATASSVLNDNDKQEKYCC